MPPAASEPVKVAKFVETQVLPALKKPQADAPTIEAVTAIVSPQAAHIERVGFAVLGIVIKGIDDGGTTAGASCASACPGTGSSSRGHQEHRLGCQGRGTARSC